MENDLPSDVGSFVSSTSPSKIQNEPVSDNPERVVPYVPSYSSVSTIGKSLKRTRNARLKQSVGPLTEKSLKGISEYILTGKAKNIILLIGAGISTSAGIPDFRSPDTGIYHNLSKYNLTPSEASFDIDIFRETPAPFYKIFKTYLTHLTNSKPTLAHYFIKLLEEKGLLMRVFTQNIDGLERAAGISPKYLVEAHGSFTTASCVKCKIKVPIEKVKSCVLEEKVCLCEICHGAVKPDIIFFGERLPECFFEYLENDCQNCDLLIIAGTSLLVYPVSLVTQIIPPHIPRVLINKESVGPFKFGSENSPPCLSENSSVVEHPRDLIETASHTEEVLMDDMFNDENLDEGTESMDLVIYDRDITWLGNCDDGFKELANHLGWTEELNELMKNKPKP